jgi:hypothetical protein
MFYPSATNKWSQTRLPEVSGSFGYVVEAYKLHARRLLTSSGRYHPGIMFNAHFDRTSHRINDNTVRRILQNGRAYQFVSGEYVQTLPPVVKAEVIAVYLEVLRAVWIGAVAFGVTGLAAVFVERHIPLWT